VGRGWDQNDWPEAIYPTAADLDVVFPDRPVWLERVDGHAFWGNSAAMRAAGIDPAAPAPADPPGGSIIRDAAERPTGVFVDNATLPIDNAVPVPGEELLAARLRAALRETTSHGLTGIHEAGVRPDTLRLYQRFIDAGEFPIRVYAMIEGAGELLDRICADGPIEGDRLVVRSMKLYADGALGSRGAALLEDYQDVPGHRGTLLLEPDVLRATLVRAMQCGLQVNTHAIGDRGVRATLDAYQAALRETGAGDGRHRIEHVQVVSDADFPRFEALGILASVQPTHATSDMPWAEARVGPDRIRGAYAWRRLIDAGARLTLGSDFPAESVDPLRGFYAAVTRQDPDGSPPGGWRAEERLTREEALRGFTLDAAYAGFMEDEVGSLEVGKRADFVMLSRDIMRVPAPEILQTRVLATYFDGEAVYRAAPGD
jgi:predicted amidohydrolase YtcJ